WSSEVELGFDAGLFKDAARFELTYYNKRTKDALISRRLPPSQGINQTRFENIGSVQNRGIEALISARQDISPKVGWDATISIALGFSQAGYITDGTFLRLREASLTYTAPDNWARTVHAQSMQFSLTGRNLLKWTNYDGIDPELNGNGQSDLPDDFLTAPPIR